jgi:hypothetical protein
VTHPFVIGEIALGNLKNWEAVLGSLLVIGGSRPQQAGLAFWAGKFRNRCPLWHGQAPPRASCAVLAWPEYALSRNCLEFA